MGRGFDWRGGVTAKGLTARNYLYCRRNIAAGDGARGSGATVSSDEPGVPPGVWHGKAAEAMGLSGVVSEPQMRALFAVGLHPDAVKIVARKLGDGSTSKEALRAARLGPAVPQLSELSPLDEEIEEVLQHAAEELCRPLTKAETQNLRMRTAARVFEAEYHRPSADGVEPGRFLAARSGPQCHARTGFDLMFASEELSLLFALGSLEVRRNVLEVLAQARAETVA